MQMRMEDTKMGDVTLKDLKLAAKDINNKIELEDPIPIGKDPQAIEDAIRTESDADGFYEGDGLAEETIETLAALNIEIQPGDGKDDADGEEHPTDPEPYNEPEEEVPVPEPETEEPEPETEEEEPAPKPKSKKKPTAPAPAEEEPAPKPKKPVKKKAMSRRQAVYRVIEEKGEKGLTIKTLESLSTAMLIEANGAAGGSASNICTNTLEALAAFDVMMKDASGVFTLLPDVED